MKKIRLNVANLDGTEILSRDQLKSIFGGSGSGSGSGGYIRKKDGSDCPLKCSHNDCSSVYNCECKHAGTTNEYCGRHS